MELLQLRYFYETAKNQNIAKTAEKHWVPASSVSASIKRLEEELGCKLFDRHSNKIELNENGKRLQRSLCLVFDELDNAVNELKTPSSDTQEIRIFVKAIRHIITDKIIYIHVNNLLAYIIPLNCFNSKEEYNDFISFIKTKCQTIDVYE